MERRTFTREFKLEAVHLVRERGVTVAQAARDLGVHGNVLRRWVREGIADPQQAFPGQGQMKPAQLELERLRREYNEERPKKALGGLTPAAYARQLANTSVTVASGLQT